MSLCNGRYHLPYAYVINHNYYALQSDCLLFGVLSVVGTCELDIGVAGDAAPIYFICGSCLLHHLVDRVLLLLYV